MGSLPEEVWTAVIQAADVILVEADGSQHYSLKYPAENEPVLPKETTEVILVEGLWDLGKPISEAVFRYKLLPECVGLRGDMPVEWSFLKNVMEPAYRERLTAAGYVGEMQILYAEKKNGDISFLTEREVPETILS